MTPSPKRGLFVPWYQWAIPEEWFSTQCHQIALSGKYSQTSHSTPCWNPDIRVLESGPGICIFCTKIDRCCCCKAGKGNHEIRHQISAFISRERKNRQTIFFKPNIKIIRDLKGQLAKCPIVFYPTATFRRPFQVRERSTKYPCHCWTVLIAGKFCRYGVKPTSFYSLVQVGPFEV